MDRIRVLAQLIVNTFEVRDLEFIPFNNVTCFGHCRYCGATGYNFDQIHANTCPVVFAHRILMIVDDLTN